MEEPSEYIDFIAKYGDWVSIKRLGIRPNTKPEEVVHHLAAIRSTIDGKAYSLLGIKTNVLDEHAKRLTQGMRKSYSSLSTALNALGTGETKTALEQSCGNKAIIPIAETYLLGKIVTSIGFDTSINQTVMSKVFPELKPPKGLGRKRKGKANAEE